MRKILSAIGLAAVCATAGAAPGQFEPYKGEVPPVLKFGQAAGLQIFKKFDAVDSLTGWVVKDANSGKQVVIYTTPSGNTMIAGMVMDKSGRNLSAEYMETHVPPPDYSAVMAEFQKATKVTVGKASAKAEVVVAFDPNCGYCKVFHRLVKPAIDAGSLKVTYVPVDILQGDSDRKAAGLLEAKDALADIEALATGAPAAVSSNPALIAKVKENTGLMRKHGFNGTPVVLYAGKQNGEDTVFVANGVPEIAQMYERLGIKVDLTSLKSDPTLGRFVR
ncbi:thiol:disulfide interchange protein DsbG [Comamonas thiooxydans]|uniref:thiol:disulfide interchange protein DsbG n=1 Tax=Comamonas thiooxydans TaxID=363952 RepID=UPI000B41DA9D|nr:thiol:disulfide interchange protein DsbG [Comamonas thiooxydans]